MKTTNLEISKKLKEIGFDAETEHYWHELNGKIKLHHVAREGFGDYKSYDLETLLDNDLETLLDALPTNKHDFFIQFDEPIKIGSYEPCGEYRGHYDMREGIFESCQKENESLADTAGRLLIKLYEAGIINFKK